VLFRSLYNGFQPQYSSNTNFSGPPPIPTSMPGMPTTSYLTRPPVAAPDNDFGDFESAPNTSNNNNNRAAPTNNKPTWEKFGGLVDLSSSALVKNEDNSKKTAANASANASSQLYSQNSFAGLDGFSRGGARGTAAPMMQSAGLNGPVMSVRQPQPGMMMPMQQQQPMNMNGGGGGGPMGNSYPGQGMGMGMGYPNLQQQQAQVQAQQYGQYAQPNMYGGGIPNAGNNVYGGMPQQQQQPQQYPVQMNNSFPNRGYPNQQQGW